MITRIATQEKTPLWRRLLDEAISDPRELLRQLELDPELLPQMIGGHNLFKVKVPLGYLGRINKGDRHDPLLLQVLPQAEETTLAPANYSDDPVGDLDASPVPGLIHKYQGRALVITSPACAINCRYCFRRNFPYRDAITSGENWLKVMRYLSDHKEINEVILSGGDPLTLADEKLAQLNRDLSSLDHLKTLRFHTRLPVVLPERIDSQFLNWTANSSLRLIMVIHCNHPDEIDQQVGETLNRLSEAGITLLNQSVLLRNINDDAEILAKLSQKLFAHEVQPYYLNLLDKVTGAAHFDVDLRRAREIYTELREKLSGYLVPRLVHDLPGRPAKTLIL